MEKQKQIKQYCQQFKTAGISNSIDSLIQQAEANHIGLMDFTLSLLKAEADHRHQNELIRKLKTARLPRYCDLSTYDHSSKNGLQKIRLNQLRELNWLDQIYNIMLMGPLGKRKNIYVRRTLRRCCSKRFQCLL